MGFHGDGSSSKDEGRILTGDRTFFHPLGPREIHGLTAIPCMISDGKLGGVGAGIVGRAFSPPLVLGRWTCGDAAGWDSGAPLALGTDGK
jgi:hypothetical protein